MPHAYWIVRVSVRDQARYPDYLAAAKPAFERFGARFIVRGGPYEAMEGSSRERNVVVEFADRETALACYRSPEYQAAKAIRNATADADFVIVDGAPAEPACAADMKISSPATPAVESARSSSNRA